MTEHSTPIRKVLKRNLGIILENGEVLKHSDSALKLERIELKNLFLIPCPPMPGGKISIEKACSKEKGLTPIDFEVMLSLFKDPNFLHFVAKKSEITIKERMIILCNGSTIYDSKNHPILKPYLQYLDGKLRDCTIPKSFWGKLPEVYKLVYIAPNTPFMYLPYLKHLVA